MSKKTARSSSDAVHSPLYVLVGPFADPIRLSEWAHGEFRKSAAVAFIGVDRGFEKLLESGLPPTLGIGDMDGILDPRKLKGPDDVPVILLKREKERSDLSIALEFCIERRARFVYAFGFQGHRADHDFAVHLDLSEASRKISRVVSIGEKGVAFYVSARHSPLKLDRKNIDALRLAGAPKTKRSANAKSTDRLRRVASLFPVGAPARGVRLRGLRFPVLNGILSLSSQGLSNEIRAREIEVGLRSGRIAVFFPA